MGQASTGRARWVLLLALLLLSAGCGPQATPVATLGASQAASPSVQVATPDTPTTRATPQATTPSNQAAMPGTPVALDSSALAAALSTTRRIYISDDRWVARVGSQNAHWHLERVDGRAVGQAEFSAIALFVAARKASPTIDIPSQNVDSFLQLLATVQYQPGVRGLSPGRSITLITSVGTIEFVFKTIFGDVIMPGERERIGWSLRFSGNEYVIPTDLPNLALDALDPYLKRDILQQLHDDAQAAFDARHTLCNQPSSSLITPAISPAPTPVSNGDHPKVGDFVNVADRLAIRQPQSITIEDADYFAKQKITDPQQLAMLIAILDWPLPVFSTSTFNLNARIGLDIATDGRQSIPLYYLPQAELLVMIEPDNSFGIGVPPEFRPTLSKILCNR